MPNTVNKIVLPGDDFEAVDIFDMVLKKAFPQIEPSVVWDEQAI